MRASQAPLVRQSHVGRPPREQSLAAHLTTAPRGTTTMPARKGPFLHGHGSGILLILWQRQMRNQPDLARICRADYVIL